MVAGCYGLPQFRMRCFLFGACSDEVLPPFPLPTHSVIVRGGIPNQWEVSYSENSQYSLLGYVDETGMEGYERLAA
jgi:DNA (cytosine-5)-methyltransferase 1